MKALPCLEHALQRVWLSDRRQRFINLIRRVGFSGKVTLPINRLPEASIDGADDCKQLATTSTHSVGGVWFWSQQEQLFGCERALSVLLSQVGSTTSHVGGGCTSQYTAAHQHEHQQKEIPRLIQLFSVQEGAIMM